MITYFYWLFVITLALFSVYLVGMRFNRWKAASATAGIIFIIGLLAYFFHFQQIFVKHWGGVMTVTVPEGHYHMMATWKEDNLWVESYDPKSDTCHFREYSRGALLEGKVLIKDCNPLMAK